MFSLEFFWDKILNMDKEQIVILAGVTLCAISIGAFIFWGPNPRPRRRGALIGLQNLGLTCFLNSLLQALASCALFVEWIESCHDQGPVGAALCYLLKVLSRERSRLPDSVEDPLAPTLLIIALREHGWSIGPGEQDAHELYHLLMVTLEEEAHKAAAAEGGLTDALEALPVPPSKYFLPVAGDCSSNLVESSHMVNEPSGDAVISSDKELINRQGEVISRKYMPKYDCNRNYQASPFCGLLTSQLHCVQCGFKSVLRYDKFDSLSLHMPATRSGHHSLTQLLDSYTHPEAVTGVACDGCNKGQDPASPPVTSTSLKTLTIGKLPKCLCIHIHRMSMGPDGSIYKRSDYVDFPEYLIMDPYTHNAMIKGQKLKGATSAQVMDPTDSDSELSDKNQTSNANMPWHHVYRLKAVVVHSGSVEGGHFVTFRKGPLLSSTRHRCDRWYFTSDETVREATLAEALQSAAYILLYEKCTSVST